MVLETIDGDTIDLGALYGRKAVYLKFWATWCVPCRQQMPHFEHAYETAGPDLAVIAVNVGFNESLQQIRRYRQELGITMPIVLDDGKLGAALNLRVTPQHIVIGRDGRILYVGHLADDHLDAAVLAARSATPTADLRSGTVRTDAPHYGVGDRLPVQQVTTLDGRRLSLGDAKAQRSTVLVFLSPWCESYLATTRPAIATGCREAREEVSLAAEGSHARWLGVASGLWAAPEDLREYRQKNQIRIPLTLDASGALFRAFNVNQVPTILIVDGTGKITQRIEAGNPQTLREALSGL
jgi:thiol-disulfide isomerase/thioredoxin